MIGCTLCPRTCLADREGGSTGYCNEGKKIHVSHISKHMFEEPPISGSNGSGTVFFAGCPLGCVFCQNKRISRNATGGMYLEPHELANIFLELQDRSVHNINLVTPTHFADGVAKALRMAKPKLKIPVVYNTSGYERAETLKMLDGLVDIYLPDLKYFSSELGKKYSNAPDYFDFALPAIEEMYRQVGRFEYENNGMLKKGLVVRHLVLPGARKDSTLLLTELSRKIPPKNMLLSLMSQYTPEFATDTPFSELHRKITTFEYNFVLDTALSLGFDGFMQGKSSAVPDFTPDFK